MTAPDSKLKGLKIDRVAMCPGNIRGKQNVLQVRVKSVNFEKNARECWLFDPYQGIVREFCDVT